MLMIVLILAMIKGNSIDLPITMENSSLYSMPTEGCTDPEAINYEPDATYGENQCWYNFEQYLWTVDLMSFYGVHPDNSLLNMLSSLPSSYQIIGQGVASQEISPNNWIGSITNIDPTKGYWIISDSDISFSYELEDIDMLSRCNNPYKNAIIPAHLEFVQSSQQAFYFIDQINLKEIEIENGDWLASYCSNSLTGSRQYLGEMVDIPVMGYDGHSSTAGYCEPGDTPHFKLYKSKTGEMLDLYTDAPKWQSNELFFLNNVQETTPLPHDFSIFKLFSFIFPYLK